MHFAEGDHTWDYLRWRLQNLTYERLGIGALGLIGVYRLSVTLNPKPLKKTSPAAFLFAWRDRTPTPPRTLQLKRQILKLPNPKAQNWPKSLTKTKSLKI